jgi:hypothetical protein
LASGFSVWDKGELLASELERFQFTGESEEGKIPPGGLTREPSSGRRAALPPAPTGAPVTPAAAVAHSCKSGFTHAVIDRAHKCLRRGQFCKRSADRQYRRYGFRCRRYDSRARRHRLT